MSFLLRKSKKKVGRIRDMGMAAAPIASPKATAPRTANAGGGQLLLQRPSNMQRNHSSKQRQCNTEVPQKQVTTTQQKQEKTLSVISMEEVYNDLRLLEEQQIESQRKLANMRLTKEHRLQQRTSLENTFESMKYSNGEQRAQLRRVRELLSSSNRELGTGRLNASRSGNHLRAFDKKLKRGLISVRICLEYRRKIDSFLILYRSKQAILMRINNEVSTKLELLEKERDGTRKHENNLRRAIQEETSNAKAIAEDTAKTRSGISMLDQELASVQQLEVSTRLRADDVQGKVEDEDKRHNEAMSSLESKLSNCVQTKENLVGEIKAKQLEVGKIKKLICRSWEHANQYHQEEDLTPCPQPTDLKTPPNIDVGIVRRQLNEEEIFLQDEIFSRDKIQDSVTKLRVELLEVEKNERTTRGKVTSTFEAAKNAELVEMERREAIEKTLRDIETVKMEVSHLHQSILDLKIKRQQNATVSMVQVEELKQNVKKKREETALFKSRQIEKSSHVEELKNAFEEERKEKTAKINEKKSVIEETNKAFKKIREQETDYATEVAQQSKKEVKNLVIAKDYNNKETDEKISCLLEKYPQLRKVKFSYDPEKSADGQIKEFLLDIHGDCEARILAAKQERLKRREAAELGRREEEERKRKEAEEHKRKEAEERERERREVEERKQKQKEDHKRTELEEQERKEAAERNRRETEEQERECREAEEREQAETEERMKREAEERELERGRERVEVKEYERKEVEEQERERRESNEREQREAEERAREGPEKRTREEAEVPNQMDVVEHELRKTEEQDCRQAGGRVRRKEEECKRRGAAEATQRKIQECKNDRERRDVEEQKIEELTKGEREEHERKEIATFKQREAEERVFVLGVAAKSGKKEIKEHESGLKKEEHELREFNERKQALREAEKHKCEQTEAEERQNELIERQRELREAEEREQELIEAEMRKREQREAKCRKRERREAEDRERNLRKELEREKERLREELGREKERRALERERERRKIEEQTRQRAEEERCKIKKREAEDFQQNERKESIRERRETVERGQKEKWERNRREEVGQRRTECKERKSREAGKGKAEECKERGAEKMKMEKHGQKLTDNSDLVKPKGRFMLYSKGIEAENVETKNCRINESAKNNGKEVNELEEKETRRKGTQWPERKESELERRAAYKRGRSTAKRREAGRQGSGMREERNWREAGKREKKECGWNQELDTEMKAEELEQRRAISRESKEHEQRKLVDREQREAGRKKAEGYEVQKVAEQERGQKLSAEQDQKEALDSEKRLSTQQERREAEREKVEGRERRKISRLEVEEAASHKQRAQPIQDKMIRFDETNPEHKKQESAPKLKRKSTSVGNTAEAIYKKCKGHKKQLEGKPLEIQIPQTVAVCVKSQTNREILNLSQSEADDDDSAVSPRSILSKFSQASLDEEKTRSQEKRVRWEDDITVSSRSVKLRNRVKESAKEKSNSGHKRDSKRQSTSRHGKESKPKSTKTKGRRSYGSKQREKDTNSDWKRKELSEKIRSKKNKVAGTVESKQKLKSGIGKLSKAEGNKKTLESHSNSNSKSKPTVDGSILKSSGSQVEKSHSYKIDSGDLKRKQSSDMTTTRKRSLSGEIHKIRPAGLHDGTSKTSKASSSAPKWSSGKRSETAALSTDDNSRKEADGGRQLPRKRKQDDTKKTSGMSLTERAPKAKRRKSKDPPGKNKLKTKTFVDDLIFHF